MYVNHIRELMLNRYRAGVEAINYGNYQEGIDDLSPLGDYKDSIQLIEYARKGLIYKEAEELIDNQEYESAAKKFEQIADFKDSEERAKSAYELANNKTEEEEAMRLNEEKYKDAKSCYETGELVKALELFNDLGDYNDSQTLAQECKIALKRLVFSNTISAGIRYSASVTQDGKVSFSGVNFSYEDELYTWNDIVSVSVMGHFVMGLKRDGTVVTAGQIDYGNTKYYIDTSEWHNIISVAAGQMYIVGLKEDGTLTAQGHNGDGQADIKDWSNIVAIDTGWRTTVGLDSDGHIHITGYGSESQLQQIEEHEEEWKDIVAISTGGGGGGIGSHTVGLRRDGTVVAVGANGARQCEVDEWEDIIAISAGNDHTVGLKADGTVVTTPTGPRTEAEISNWENIVAISSGYGFTLGLKDDGSVVAVGNYKNGQSNVEPWNNIARHEEWKLVFDKDFDFLFHNQSR